MARGNSVRTVYPYSCSVLKTCSEMMTFSCALCYESPKILVIHAGFGESERGRDP